MTIYTIKPLGPDTWDDFARLIERQGKGSMGASFCWCTNFHPPAPDDNRSSEGRRAYQEQLVSHGRAHAALGPRAALARILLTASSVQPVPAAPDRPEPTPAGQARRVKKQAQAEATT